MKTKSDPGGSVQRLVSLRLTIKQLGLVSTVIENSAANSTTEELEDEFRAILVKCERVLGREQAANDELSHRRTKPPGCAADVYRRLRAVICYGR